MTKTAVAKTEQNAVVAYDDDLEALLAANAGAGVSSDPAHNTIPMVYVLQTNSPQVNKRNDKYVTNAEPGDLWLKNGATPVIKGTEGVLFQPCHLDWKWVEWKPNREGFVTTHDVRPNEATQQHLDPTDDRMSWVLPNGNLLVETCYVYGLVNFEFPYVIPLSSSGFRVARDWNTDIRNRKHNGKPLPVFGTKYMLKTVLRTNNKGEWFTLGFEFVEGLPTAEQVRTGLDFFKAVSSGEKKAAQEEATEVPF